MARNTHRDNCANAQNPGCVCSGCGGALHGWQGWTKLALDDKAARQGQRRKLEAKIERHRRTGALCSNAQNRQATVDLARLDITDYLSATSPIKLPADQGENSIALPDPALSSSDLGRLSALGDTLMAETWEDISKDIDNEWKNEQKAREVKKHLADHTWCALLVALIRLIEQIDAAVRILTDRAKQFVKDVVVEHMADRIGKLAEVVVDIVIDRVWSALARLVQTHFPLTGEDTLRALRMLALFACPSVEKHPDVYRYTVSPLMGDALHLVSDDVKAQVTTLFTAWWQKRGPEALT